MELGLLTLYDEMDDDYDDDDEKMDDGEDDGKGGIASKEVVELGL